jgi:hypothetical protein
VGGAGPFRGSEVTGVGVGACYGGSGVAGVGQRGGRRLGDLDGRVVSTRPRSERGEQWRKSSRRARVTPVRNSGRQERQSAMIGLGLVPVDVGEHSGPKPGHWTGSGWPDTVRARRASAAARQQSQIGYGQA